MGNLYRSCEVSQLLIVYITVINLIGFIMMGVDKKKAIRHKWRIPEKMFFLVSLLGGSSGTWAGMYVFRHKTRHWYFVVGMPVILGVQIAVCVGLRYFA